MQTPCEDFNDFQAACRSATLSAVDVLSLSSLALLSSSGSNNDASMNWNWTKIVSTFHTHHTQKHTTQY